MRGTTIIIVGRIGKQQSSSGGKGYDETDI